MRISLIIGAIVVAVGVAVVLVFSRGSESRLSEPQTAAPTTSTPSAPHLPASPPTTTAPRPHPEALRPPPASPPERTNADAAEAACIAKDAATAQKYYDQLDVKARARISLACQAAGITLKDKAPASAP